MLLERLCRFESNFQSTNELFVVKGKFGMMGRWEDEHLLCNKFVNLVVGAPGVNPCQLPKMRSCPP